MFTNKSVTTLLWKGKVLEKWSEEEKG